ncbi:MAG: HAD hydrolase family protein [Collinsella sp.]
MIRWAGLGVAMDNAIDETKGRADMVTSNSEDGIAHALACAMGMVSNSNKEEERKLVSFSVSKRSSSIWMA